MKAQLAEAIKYWSRVSPVVAYPKNKKAFQTLVAMLDELLEIVGDNENHQLMSLIDVMSQLVATYEAEHFSAPKTRGIDALNFLMEAHNLSQSDLPEIGSQGVVSEILNQKRTLNLRQIKCLAKRFGVSPLTFVDGEE